MRPKFTVIVPTYKRPTEVMRAVNSVLKQTYVDWRLYVVIDDIESDYRELLTMPQHDSRINVIRNECNLGKNYSINSVLEKLNTEEFDGYVVYLDDDDWLAPNCLRDYADEISANSSLNWLVSNRVIESGGKLITKSKLGTGFIHYLRGNLLRRKIFGDATHCIHFPSTKYCRYSTRIRNAEEWLYFAQIAVIHPHFKYLNSTGTFTYGYGEGGLTAHRADIRSLGRISTLFKETLAFKILNPYVYIYLCGRTVKTLTFKLRRFFN